MDRLCRQYLDEYDCVCADYGKTIHSRQPSSVGDELYFEFNKQVPNP